MNIATIVGRLGRNPEEFNGGARLSVATNERKKDPERGWVKYPEWHRVVVFGKQAEFVVGYLEKGSIVAIRGSLHTNKWEDKAGIPRYTTEIIADSVESVRDSVRDGDESF